MVALVEATEAATAASSALIVRHITLLLSPRPIARLTQGEEPGCGGVLKSRHRAACHQSAITPPSARSAPRECDDVGVIVSLGLSHPYEGEVNKIISEGLIVSQFSQTSAFAW
jgi:hypothetical protein